MQGSGIVAIVPMKPLPLAKTRLSLELSDSQRMAIGRNLLRRVLRALKGVGPSLMNESRLESVWVVGGGADVSRIAEEEGALWCEEEGSDINESLQLAFQGALDAGKAALFLPGDLPFLKPQDIYSLVGASGRLKSLILSPARQGGGTNGILVVPGLAQPFLPLLGARQLQASPLPGHDVGYFRGDLLQQGAGLRPGHPRRPEGIRVHRAGPLSDAD